MADEAPDPESEPEIEPELDVSNLLLLVVGAHLRAEAADRPLAYQLRDRIQMWLKNRAGEMNVLLAPLVCCDVWYVNQQSLHRRPTISIGGPGVNALSAYYTNKLSPALVHENHKVIQLDPEFTDLRVCIWGRNHDLTVDAINMFIDKYLDGYMRAVVTQVEPREE